MCDICYNDSLYHITHTLMSVSISREVDREVETSFWLNRSTDVLLFVSLEKARVEVTLPDCCTVFCLSVYRLWWHDFVYHCLLYEFTIASSDHRQGVPGPRRPGQTRVLFKFRQPVDLFHTLKTVQGLLHLVPPRTLWSSGHGVLCTCGLCYMLFLLYV